MNGYSEFTPLPFPGRVYDAAFSHEGLGIALVEPGVIYFREADQPWSAVPRTLAPPSVSQLDRAEVPEALWTLVDEAPNNQPPLDREFLAGVERAWLTELVQRFAQHRGATLPDVVPSLMYRLLSHNIIAPPAGVELYITKPLAQGWLARGPGDSGGVLFHVSPDLTTRVLAEGPGMALLSSHDGGETLALGGPCLSQEADGDKTDRACFTDASGPHTVLLPPDIVCADVFAIGSGQLLVGGEGCPAEVCGDHLLVRFDLRQDRAPLNAIPVPVEGDATPPAPQRDLEGCDFAVDATSDILPDGASVVGVVSTAAGDRLLSGPLNGTLRALPIPADGGAAFADARHGVFANRRHAWTTSNGGESWDPVPTPVDWSSSREGLSCSAEACRLGNRYWMVGDFADRLGLERSPLGIAETNRSPAWPRPFIHPWSLTTPTPASLTPSNELVPLRQSPSSHWRSQVWPVVGGIVETNSARPNHTGDLAWRGVTEEGVPFQVVTTATNPDRPSAPLQLHEHYVIAMTEKFVALLLPASGGASMDLWVIRSNGQSSRHAARLPLMAPHEWERARWPLPLPDGGLGLYVFIQGIRWLVRFSREGDVQAQRVFEGPHYLRDEFLAWHDGELGLAVRAGDDLARLYLIDGSEREIALPQSPGGPCLAAAHPRSNRFASRWSEPRAVVEGAVPENAEWFMSEEHDGHACTRAMALRWRTASNDALRNGSRLVMAVGGSFRGWFTSTAGIVEWPVTVPGVPAPIFVPANEYSDLPMSALGLSSTRDGLHLWAPLPAGTDPVGVSMFTWGSQQFTTRSSRSLTSSDEYVSLSFGILATGEAAYPLHDGAVQSRLEPPEHGRFATAVHDERGTVFVTYLTSGGHRVDWPGNHGEDFHAYLPGEVTSGAWRLPAITPDARTVVMLTSRRQQGGPTLQVHRLRPDGSIHTAPASELGVDTSGQPIQFAVASAGQSVLAAIAASRGAPIHVFGASRDGAFRILGHPIATSRCRGNVLSLAAAPPRIVWTDCAIGTDHRFVRVAQLTGNRWREVVEAHALPRGYPHVAAIIDDAHGVYVDYLENHEAVLVTPRGTGWEVVTRYGGAGVPATPLPSASN